MQEGGHRQVFLRYPGDLPSPSNVGHCVSCWRFMLKRCVFKGVGAVGEVVFGKEGGEYGRPTGEALVRFDSKEVADQAVKLNGQFIGNRYGLSPMSAAVEGIWAQPFWLL